MNISSKLLLLSSIIGLAACNGITNTKGNKTSLIIDTVGKADTTIIMELERAALKKQRNHPGDLLYQISFNVRTNDKEFENGIIPWVSIEKPETDIPQLLDKDKTVISESKLTIIIDYPVLNEYRFELESADGFTREELIKEISKNYYKLYEEEEATATIKTIPIDKRTTMYNRNQTNGKYGVWGHDIADLALTEISVYKAANGQLLVILNILS